MNFDFSKEDVSAGKLSLRVSFGFVLLFFSICVILSSLIPPFMAPDEHDHIKRAYLLTKGSIFLGSRPGMSSGGNIDTGLLAYMDSYPRNLDKVNGELIDRASDIKWTGREAYSQAPGTGYYFPIIYTPQALGLLIGEKAHFSISVSYKMARFFTLLSTSALIFISFLIYSPSFLTVSLIFLPASIYQSSSAAIDGLSIAIAVLVVSIFFRLCHAGKAPSHLWLFLLSVLLVILTTARVYLIGCLCFFSFFLFYTSRSKKVYVYFLCSTCAVLLWTVLAMKSVIDLRVFKSVSTEYVVRFYICHPWEYFKILGRTLSNHKFVKGYIRQFIGMLGWSGGRFSKTSYTFFEICLLVLLIISFSFRKLVSEWKQRGLLFGIMLSSILCMFFSLLVTWNPYPTVLIDGVVGRYFIVPIIILSYGISEGIISLNGIFRRWGWGVFFLYCLGSITLTIDLVVNKFYCH